MPISTLAASWSRIGRSGTLDALDGSLLAQYGSGSVSVHDLGCLGGAHCRCAGNAFFSSGEEASYASHVLLQFPGIATNAVATRCRVLISLQSRRWVGARTS
jgi:hypothetical protein